MLLYSACHLNPTFFTKLLNFGQAYPDPDNIKIVILTNQKCVYLRNAAFDEGNFAKMELSTHRIVYMKMYQGCIIVFIQTIQIR